MRFFRISFMANENKTEMKLKQNEKKEENHAGEINVMAFESTIDVSDNAQANNVRF